MSTKDEGLKLLKSIKTITHLIEETQEQIERTRALMLSTTIKAKSVNVQTSTPGDIMADTMAKVLEYESTIQKYLKELCEKKTLVINILLQMDVESQELLTVRYLKGRTIEQTAEEVHRSSYYHTWEALHKAEEEFCKIYANTV